MENKLQIIIAEENGTYRTTTRIVGDANVWWKKQLKKNQAKAVGITSDNNIYTGQEDTHFYDCQLKKFLKRYEGLKNVEIVRT